MRIVQSYSHMNGLEYLLVHKPSLWDEIKVVIEGVDAAANRVKVSREKTMLGNLLYSPAHLNKAFYAAFHRAKWKSQTARYWVTDDIDLIRKPLCVTR